MRITGIKGHHLEASVRTALITAFQNYFSIYGNYGRYQKISIANKQIKIGSHTVDGERVTFAEGELVSGLRFITKFALWDGDKALL